MVCDVLCPSEHIRTATRRDPTRLHSHHMSIHSRDHDGDGDLGPSCTDEPADERYTVAELDEGYVLLYDRQDNAAWIKSNIAIPLEETT